MVAVVLVADAMMAEDMVVVTATILMTVAAVAERERERARAKVAAGAAASAPNADVARAKVATASAPNADMARARAAAASAPNAAVARERVAVVTTGATAAKCRQIDSGDMESAWQGQGAPVRNDCPFDEIVNVNCLRRIFFLMNCSALFFQNSCPIQLMKNNDRQKRMATNTTSPGVDV